MHQLADKILVLVAGAVLGGCTVADAKVWQERQLEEPVADDAGDQSGESCGCDPGDGPQQGGACFPCTENDNVKSRAVTLENCSEVQVPWCDAQFGCHMVETKCFCMNDVSDIGIILPGGHWICDPVPDTETVEVCKTVQSGG